jgi:hypothetical protein
MVIVDCPWCDGPVPLEAEGAHVRCDACCVAAEVAVDPASAQDLAAAA